MRLDDQDNQFLDAKEVEEQYQIKQGSLYRYRELGLINAYRFPADKKTYWKKDELEKLKMGKSGNPQVIPLAPNPKTAAILDINPMAAQPLAV